MKAVALACSLALFFAAPSRAADEPAVVSVAASRPGAAISANALGLSYETSRLLPDENGARYFRPDNVPLVNVFRTLGIKSLRIGGNSVDDAKIPLPSADDVKSLFEFARVAGVKVIYSVRLHDGDPQSAAQVATLIHDHYADLLESFAIGNEPGYYKKYQVYLAKWTAIRDAIVAVYPEAVFCGADQNPDDTLIANLVRDLGNSSGRLVQITQHHYPFGCSYENPQVAWKGGDVRKLIPVDALTAREKILSPDAYAIYSRIQKGMAKAVAGTSLGYRLTETNSYWFSGLKGASDSAASALWAADYTHWWAANGAEGLNFHTGDRTGGSVNLPCRYAAFVTSGDGYEVRPLGYGLKLFASGSDGRSLPVTLSDPADDLAAYATLASSTEGKTAYVTLIHKAHGPAAAPRSVSIRLDTQATIAAAEAMFFGSRMTTSRAAPPT